MKNDKDKKPQELEHKVKLCGAKSPRNFFTITCPPEGKHYTDICSHHQLKTSSTVEYVERPAGVISRKRKPSGRSEKGGKYSVFVRCDHDDVYNKQ